MDEVKRVVREAKESKVEVPDFEGFEKELRRVNDRVGGVEQSVMVFT